MIIFMAGFPYSGKTYVVDKLLELFPDIVVISPKFFRPDNYSELSEDDKREVNISSWSCSLDQLVSAIKEYNDKKVIVYDTSCASYDSMNNYFSLAKNSHTVIYVYVNSNIKLCQKRAGSEWLSEEVVKKYINNFKTSISKLSKMSNKFFIIHNEGEPNLEEVTDYLESYDGNVRICESK